MARFKPPLCGFSCAEISGKEAFDPMNDTFMKTKPVFPLLVSMALPNVISMLVNSLYNIVDSLFVAQINEQAMTALSLVFPIQNFVNAVAIGFGMGIILLCMVFNIINSFKTHDVEKTWFDTNAVAGLVFYGFLVLTVVLYMTGHKTPGNVMLVIFLGIPVLLFVFKEPLGNLVEKRHKKMEGGKVMFFVQAFFELFETMLSYFSNTISYVRIGAFAVSHAAMMEVVLMLSGASAGSTNWIIFVIGNIIVCGLEGLVVGIQVLRLEYYEMFSRFYKGTGREFKPFHKQSE